MKNRRFLRDAGLILAIAAAALIIFAAGRIFRSEGDTVEVRLGGELYAVLPLSKDAELDIGGLCVLIIENGEAHISEAVCHNQICVHHRPISKSGEAIVCLPSGVTVKVSGGGADFYI